MKLGASLAGGTLLAGLIAACAPMDDTPRTDPAKGAMLFAQQCAACHGDDAGGAGPAALGLGDTPPNLRILSKRNGGTFPRNEVMSVIDGYARRTHPRAAMPEFGEGDMGPIVIIEEDGRTTPVPADLLALANYLESIQE